MFSATHSADPWCAPEFMRTLLSIELASRGFALVQVYRANQSTPLQAGRSRPVHPAKSSGLVMYLTDLGPSGKFKVLSSPCYSPMR